MFGFAAADLFKDNRGYWHLFEGSARQSQGARIAGNKTPSNKMGLGLAKQSAAA